MCNDSDEMVVLTTEEEKEEFEQWLNSRAEVTEYEYEQLCEIRQEDVTAVKAGEEKSIRAERAVFIWVIQAANTQNL